MWVWSLGVHGDAEEAPGVLEAAGAEAAPPFPTESHAGHARVPTERVCFIHSLPFYPSAHVLSQRVNVWQMFLFRNNSGELWWFLEFWVSASRLSHFG